MNHPPNAPVRDPSGAVSFGRLVISVPRAAYRLVYLLAVTVFYYDLQLSVDLAARITPSRFEHKRRGIALAWLRHVRKGIGQSISVYGPIPRDPLFLVSNHVTWQDVMVQTVLLEVRPVVMDSMRDMPMVGRFFRALDCIFVSRKSDEVSRVNAEIERRLERGESIMIAPEGVISPGRSVQRFRAALLEAPARKQFPVHYCALHYHTPHGWPPPSRSVLFGPDPYYRTPDGAIPQSQLDMWGPPRMFLPAFLRLLSLPYHRLNVTFGESPIIGEDRIELANALHAAVCREFHPIE